MNRQRFNNYVKEADFVGLFNEMGWNNGSFSDSVVSKVDEVLYSMQCVAQRSGFKVYVCDVKFIPLMTVVRDIDKRLRKSSNDYILILRSTSESMHHEWIVPVKTLEKRVLVPIEYISSDQLDFLYSKVDELSFGLEEHTTILDVTKRIGGAFIQNSEKITKDFYSGFSKQHNIFAGFVTGIDVDKDRQWYVSVMLNRLMFCYFIQKKGFLNFDTNYLQNKLRECNKLKGKDRFFTSFYKFFLVALFHDGLNNPAHDTPEFIAKYGHIPYLNGGMFDDHYVEKEYPNIDIKDEAFESLFSFFDKYHWHLDTRIEASGKDINPDVIGYIFEQYINDRAQMGAYYTKEDITNYIGKNCVLPFLWDKVSKTLDISGAFSYLKESGDRYIYASVKKGILDEEGNINKLPENVAIGLNAEQPNLIERRKDWNTQTPEEYGLPTEIWRETVERRRRYFNLVSLIKNGSILSVNDFITYNLDIITFTQDYLSTVSDCNFIGAFYKSLLELTVLDPTCGSGAFLFAAMNILEPLYDICIDRMEEYHCKDSSLFEEQLSEITGKFRSNRPYFIYKTIILRNLYGVDIMQEAVEIAKLRLFLKMVAVVEVDRRSPNLGLDPLPDIDFNIRCGNTLVGFANEKELLDDFSGNDTNMFAAMEWEERIRESVKKIAATYKEFRSLQLTQLNNIREFKKSKSILNEMLQVLNGMLNTYLYEKKTGTKTFEEWLEDAQPFHWFVEFYDVICEKGGFDVIIGNPPYVEYAKINPITNKAIEDYYSLENYRTLECGNLYAFVFERVFSLCKYENGIIGMIVPLSSVSTPRMKPLSDFFNEKRTIKYYSFYAGDSNPSILFSGVKMQLSIQIHINSEQNKKYTTDYKRWNDGYREYLFDTVKYIENDISTEFPLFKTGDSMFLGILRKMLAIKNNYYSKPSLTGDELYYRNASGSYYRLFLRNQPKIYINGKETKSTTLKVLQYDQIGFAHCVYSSSLFHVFWVAISDNYHITRKEFQYFPLIERYDPVLFNKLSDELSISFEKNSSYRVELDNRGGNTRKLQIFEPRKSKSIIDKIDIALGKYYGFNDEQIDYILNYDIKFRLGADFNINQGD